MYGEKKGDKKSEDFCNTHNVFNALSIYAVLKARYVFTSLDSLFPLIVSLSLFFSPLLFFII